MIAQILSLLKYWKAGGIVLLVVGFLISSHLAKSRGEKLQMAQRTIETERAKFQTQLKNIEKATQDEKERNEFRKNQVKKIKLADDGALRDAYELLRERAGRKASR